MKKVLFLASMTPDVDVPEASEPKEKLHMTWVYVGPSGDWEKLAAELSEAAGSMKPFKASFDRTEKLGKALAAMTDSPEAHEFGMSMLDRFPTKYRHPEFKAHVTLLKKGSETFPVDFGVEVKDVSLVEVSADRSYKVLATFPLTGR